MRPVLRGQDTDRGCTLLRQLRMECVCSCFKLLNNQCVLECWGRNLYPGNAWIFFWASWSRYSQHMSSVIKPKLVVLPYMLRVLP